MGVIISVCMAGGFFMIFFINFFITNTAKNQIIDNPDAIAPKQVALVLGAQVRPNGHLSDMLADRVLTGIELYKKGKVKKLLFTGDHGRRAYDEVNSMRRFALKRGIPPQDIFMDHAGFDTYSSIYRAKNVFQVRSMIIVTQKFHLPRALYIAHGLGIDAAGMAADRRHYLLRAERYSETREFPARVKAFLDLTFHRKPKFLGKTLPVSGDGRITWD